MNSEHNWKWQAIVDSCDCSSRSCHHDPHNWMTASWNCWVAPWTSAQACSALPPNPYSHLEAPTHIFLLSQSEVSCKDSSSSSVMHGLHKFSLSPQSKSIRSWPSSTKTCTKNIKQAPKTKTLALTVNAKFHSLSLKFRLLVWLWPLIQSHVYILCKSMILRKEKEISLFLSFFAAMQTRKNQQNKCLTALLLPCTWPILQDSEKVQVQNCGLNITKSAAALLLLLLPHTFHCQIFLLAAAAWGILSCQPNQDSFSTIPKTYKPWGE